MAQLAAVLPRPVNHIQAPTQTPRNEHNQPVTSFEIPKYGNRKGFTPRLPEHFGDGGAFPEIHIFQFPLNMRGKVGDSSTVPIQLDSDGQIRYDAILGHGVNGQKVHSRALALREKDYNSKDLLRPSEDVEEETKTKTLAALESIVNSKLTAARPTASVEQQGGSTYIRYVPQNDANNEKIIRMVEMPKDPLEPPKFKHKRVPGGPPEPPVPVLHSPPKKVTVADQQAWKIPPCISNWKNAKGYTIPLDKRLAADGRGLQEVQVNSNFAKLSESLSLAERNARDEIRQRADIQTRIAAQKRAAKQDKLRLMADKARRERLGEEEEEEVGVEGEEEDEEEAMLSKRERDELRYERKRERERQRHLSNYGGKKSKADRDADRDIGERMALGEISATSKETMYDQRLFNQSQGMDQGFGDDDSYNIYDKPLFKGSSANFIFRPKKGDDDIYGGEETEKLLKTDRFKPNRDFSGVDRSKGSSSRHAPVEFEKRDRDRDDVQEEADFRREQRNEEKDEEDLFGLDSFLSEAKEAIRRDPLGKIGKSGGMSAAGGGSGTYEELSSAGRNRDRVNFESKGVEKSAVEPTRSHSDSARDNERDRERNRESERDRERESHRHRDRDRNTDRDRYRDGKDREGRSRKRSRSRSRSKSRERKRSRK